MPIVLNVPGFLIYQSSEYDRVIQGSEYAWIIPEYAVICLNMLKSVWFDFVLHFSISSFAQQNLFYLNFLLNETSIGD